jgi:maltose O-acetyltransferase
MIKKCGKNIIVDRGAYFGQNLEIGDYSQIGINSQLGTTPPAGIVIGNNVMMAPDVVIMTANHKHDDITVPMQGQGFEAAPVIIEDDVWIGMRAIILPGVRVGRSSIIGAGAVVAKDIPPFSIVVGNPGRVVRKRDGSPII